MQFNFQQELQAFLHANPKLVESGRWVMVDDQNVAEQNPQLLAGSNITVRHFVKTNPFVGLTTEGAEQLGQLILAASMRRNAAKLSAFLSEASTEVFEGVSLARKRDVLQIVHVL
eukprot:480455-Amphidinium_carterae.1